MAFVELGPKLARAADVLTADLMKVKSGESVLITTDTASDMVAVRSIQDAAYRLGAKVATMVLAPEVPFQGTLADQYLSDPVKAATAACDVWIDMCFPYLAGSSAFVKAATNGRTRYLLCGDVGVDQLVRLFAQVDLGDLLQLSDALITYISSSVGKTCRVTNALGTDVTFVLAETEGLGFAVADQPGGYFMPGTVLLTPDVESVKGDIVVRHFFHEYYTDTWEPLTFKVDGPIREVIGGGSDNKVMKRALKRTGGDGYGHIVHFTCSFHPSARTTGKSFNEDLRVLGSNAIGLGVPSWAEGGGENHPDSVVTMQSLWIGDEQVMKEGVFVGPAHIVELADALVPIFT